MKPYYQSPTVTLYHADYRDVLPHLDKHTCDLLLTDPPYGVNWESSHRAETFGKLTGDDGSLDVAQALRDLLPTLRQGRHVYVFGRYDLVDVPLGGMAELIWDKAMLGMGDLASPWAPSHEYITFATYTPSRANRESGNGRLAARLRRGSVLRYPRPNSRAVRHPSEKPVSLLRELIESSSRLGETVLDPFCGSGSTLEAARLEGRKSIGVELEERWCELAATRLDQAVAVCP